MLPGQLYGSAAWTELPEPAIRKQCDVWRTAVMATKKKSKEQDDGSSYVHLPLTHIKDPSTLDALSSIQLLVAV